MSETNIAVSDKLEAVRGVAGKYQPYPEYKESGVEWLGIIPTHWVVQKISWHFQAEKGKNGQLLTKEFCGSNPGEYPVYSGQTENEGVMGRIDTYEFDAGGEGVLFSTTVGAKAMQLSHIKGKFSLSQNCMVIIPVSSYFATKYSYYHFQPLFRYERGLIPEHMQASFRMEDLYHYVVAMPPHSEQRTIAAFLDHETARIDALIAKQQRLITLLKEKRQAVISHAVTKGLPSINGNDAPMKDSGVEWLGQVPAHWDVMSLKYLVDEKVAGPYGASLTKAMYTSSGYRVYGQQQVIADDFESGDYFISPDKYEKMKRYTVYPGDVLISVMGTVGRAAVVPDGVTPGIINPRLVRYRFCHKRLMPQFVQKLLLSTQYQNRLREASQGSTMEGLNMVILGDLPLVLPSLTEQNSIIQFIQQTNNKFSHAINTASNLVDLAQERRTALISAAVTGKIDLRAWQSPKVEGG